MRSRPPRGYYPPLKLGLLGTTFHGNSRGQPLLHSVLDMIKVLGSNKGLMLDGLETDFLQAKLPLLQR